MSFMDKYLQLQALQQQHLQQQIPATGSPNQMGGQTFPEQYPNPVGTGSSAAIESAKRSLEMNKMEKNRAMGHALMQVFTALGTPGHGPGRSGTLGALVHSMPHAVNAYEAEEDKVRNLNSHLMHREDVLRHQAMSQAQNMQQHEAMLGEQRRHHQQIEGLRATKMGAGQAPIVQTEKGPLDLSNYPAITSQQQRNAISKDYRGFNKVSREIQHIKKDFAALKMATEKNTFSPSGSVIPGVNTAKDIGARILPGEAGRGLNQEMILRERLRSRFEQLQPVMEQSLKGSAAGEQMLKRFHELNVYPSIGQPMNLLEDKISELEKTIDDQKEVSKLSLMTGHQIDFLPESEQEEQHLSDEAKAAIRDFREKHPDAVQDADDLTVLDAIKQLSEAGQEW